MVSSPSPRRRRGGSLYGVVLLSHEVASLAELPRRPKDDSVGVVELRRSLTLQFELVSSDLCHVLTIVRRGAEVGLQALRRVGEAKVTHGLDTEARHGRITLGIERYIDDPAYHLVCHTFLASRRWSVQRVGLLLGLLRLCFLRVLHRLPSSLEGEIVGGCWCDRLGLCRCSLGWSWCGLCLRCGGRGGWCWCALLLVVVDDVPRADVGVPASVKLSALDVHGRRHRLPDREGELLDVIAEEADTDLAGVLPLRLEDEVLLLPLVARLRRPRLHREDVKDDARNVKGRAVGRCNFAHNYLIISDYVLSVPVLY